MLPSILNELGYLADFPALIWLPVRSWFLTAPLLYLYARQLTGHLRWRRDWRHLIPAIVELVAALLLFGYAFGSDGALGDEQTNARTLHTYFYVSLAYSVGYYIATVVLVRRHNERLLDRYSRLAGRRLHWIIWTAAAIVAVSVLFVREAFVSITGTSSGDYLLVSIANVVIIYFVAINGLRQLRAINCRIYSK